MFAWHTHFWLYRTLLSMLIFSLLILFLFSYFMIGRVLSEQDGGSMTSRSKYGVPWDQSLLSHRSSSELPSFSRNGRISMVPHSAGLHSAWAEDVEGRKIAVALFPWKPRALGTSQPIFPSCNLPNLSQDAPEGHQKHCYCYLVICRIYPQFSR